MQKQVEQLGIDLNGRGISCTILPLVFHPVQSERLYCMHPGCKSIWLAVYCKCLHCIKGKHKYLCTSPAFAIHRKSNGLSAEMQTIQLL